MNDCSMKLQLARRLTATLVLALWGTGATHAATERLRVDATSHVFNWEKDYASGLSPGGPVAALGNLSLHLTPGLYGSNEWRPARVAVYDATPDASRAFLATGYKFEIKACGPTFLILNWTGTMGDEELTLIQLDLTQDNKRWRIAKVTMTRHSTRQNTTIQDVAPWADTCPAMRPGKHPSTGP